MSNTTKTLVRCCSDYTKFRDILEKSKNILVLTGAGISAESGIPIFRGTGGWWRSYKAENLASPIAFEANPSLVWEFYSYRREVAFNANPNKAHLALAQYEKKCLTENRKLSIITQNVDGLHLRAGSQSVIELHGALRKVKCTKCKYVYENSDHPICEALRGRGNPDSIQQNLTCISVNELPKCTKCESLLRPDIVWFGEQINSKHLEDSRKLVEECDLCLVVGTSSVVYPAALFAPTAAARGAHVAEFNLSEDPFKEDFTFHFSGPCATTLPKALGIDVTE
ncbi:hypothetical protein WA026_008986 [Henosepilachna vigintioctopunctata]|uniref:NAD-dependent protein deacylase n=1 Tax=Henosepilachna vigintioctopunctata TaxID=420089 RepID=A0AAW1V6A9_9CUCU